MRNIRRPLPKRTCVACREVRAKRDLIRLVQIAGGGVEVDLTGKKAGRGAYLCPSSSCWETGLKKDRLEHALRARMTPEDRQQLILYGKELYQPRGWVDE